MRLKPSISLLALVCLPACIPAVHAQVNYGTAFNPFTFEGTHIDGYNGASSSYTFKSGNNLQDGNSSTPDYYKAPSFGWQIDGYVGMNNTVAQFIDPGVGVVNKTYVGSGAVTYPGTTGSTQYQYADAFNLNSGYSATGLFAAPGLGSNFMDTYTATTGDKPYTAQLSLSFLATISRTVTLTVAFGGRDNYASPSNSSESTAWYRIIDRSDGNSVVGYGNTGGYANNVNGVSKYNSMDYYFTGGSSTNTVSSAPVNDGVAYASWEYYKSAWSATAGHIYDLQILLPEELNFDLASGSTYQDITGIVLAPIPEPSTYGLLGAGALAGIAVWRRRRKFHRVS